MPRWKTQTTESRFWSHVDKSSNDGCWLWTGSLNPTGGYGQFIIKSWLENGKSKKVREYVHRFSYTLVIGPIPIGFDLDHLCRNRSCCNPSHLEPVTRRENLLRGKTLTAINAAKTHCNKGHEYTPENTYIERLPDRQKRHCRKCRKANILRYKQKHS